MSAVVVSRKDAVNTRFAANTGAYATNAATRYRNQAGSNSRAEGGSAKARSSVRPSTAYSGGRAGRQRAFSAMARKTLKRIAANASAFTVQVVPKSRPNVAGLRVSSNRKAAPGRKKCGLNAPLGVRVARAAARTATTAKASTKASAAT